MQRIVLVALNTSPSDSTPTTQATTVHPQTAPVPARVTSTVNDQFPPAQLREDTPKLLAILAKAPLAPFVADRQAWRAITIGKNWGVLNAHATAVNVSSTNDVQQAMPQEIVVSAISSGVITVIANDLSTVAPPAQWLLDQLDRRFSKFK